MTPTPSLVPSPTPCGDCLSVVSTFLNHTGTTTTSTSLTSTGAEVDVYLPVEGPIAVFASTNCFPSKGGAPRNAVYDLQADGSASSQPLERHLLSAIDHGALGVFTIFTGLSSGNHTIALRHATSDASYGITSNNIDLVAMPLISYGDEFELNYGEAELGGAGDFTSSTIPVLVAGLSTTVDLDIGGKILASLAINASTGPGPAAGCTGSWELEIDGSPVGTTISKYLAGADDIGAISVHGLSDVLAPGPHLITVRHSTDSELVGIRSFNGTLMAIALADNGALGNIVIEAEQATVTSPVETDWTVLTDVPGSAISVAQARPGRLMLLSALNCDSGPGSAPIFSGLYNLVMDGTPLSQIASNDIMNVGHIGSPSLVGISQASSPGVYSGWLRHATSNPATHLVTDDVTLVMFGSCAQAAPSPSSTPTPSATPTSTPSPIHHTPSPTPTAPSKTPSPTPHKTPTPVKTAPPTPVRTPTPVKTAPPTPVRTPTPAVPSPSPACRCYVIAQNGPAGDYKNMLAAVKTWDFDPATNEQPLGPTTGTSGIESIAYNRFDGELYGVNYDYLGTFDSGNGEFFQYPYPVGKIYGRLGWIDVVDIDGLSFDPAGNLWASVRRDGPDLLIQIDLTTGQAVPGIFNGDDYLVVEPLPSGADDIDDIAFNPADGHMFVVMNKSGHGDAIAKVDVATGEPVLIGRIYDPDLGVMVQDVEGLGIGCDGLLWGVTGNKNIPEINDRLWQIYWDTPTQTFHVHQPRKLSYGTDYEGVTCGDLPAPPPTPVPVMIAGGDYNGDGTADPAVFRPATGLWAVRNLGNVYFGAQGDIPIPGDYSGTGTDAPAVFRPSAALWNVRALTRFYFGGANDIAAAADYDGDGTVDSGIYRPHINLWALRGISKVWFGAERDIPVAGDYDGDGTADIALYRGKKGLWFIYGITRFYLGREGDIPTRFEDGSGLSRAAVFRPATGLWAVHGLTRLYYGAAGDLPIPGDYSGGGDDVSAIYRAYLSKWLIRNRTSFFYGRPGDMPVAR